MHHWVLRKLQHEAERYLELRLHTKEALVLLIIGPSYFLLTGRVLIWEVNVQYITQGFLFCPDICMHERVVFSLQAYSVVYNL